MKKIKLLFTLAIPVFLAQGVQAQTSSRLMAQAHWTNNGAIFIPSDSTAYNYYSSERGGDLKHQLKYDNSTNWVYVGDTAYANAYNYIQTFDASNNLTSNVTQYWNGTSWVNYSKTLYFYDSTNTLSNSIMQLWGGSNWVNISTDIYSYNAGGQLYSDQYQTWNTGTSAFDPSSQKVYYYNPSGTRSQEVDQVYNTTLGAYDYSSRYTYTYSTSNQPLTTTYSTWDGAEWVNSSMYTNTYDSTGNKTALLYQTYDGTSSTWINSTLNTYSDFASGMPQTEVDQTWDASSTGVWVNNTEYMYTYNSYNQMTSSVGESWNVAGFWEFANGDPMANYYYSEFTTAVTNVVNKGGDANIYPVPAQNTLHIDLTWTTAQAATVVIYDVQGRVINQWQTPVGTQYNNTISVNNFADGTYIVKINGTQGQVVKQIVVAH